MSEEERSNCYKKNYFSEKCFDCENKMVCRDKVYDELLKQFEEKEKKKERNIDYGDEKPWANSDIFFIDYGDEKPWANIDVFFQIDLENNLLEEPPTYIDNQNISLEQSERKRLFSSGKIFVIIIGKEETEQ